MSLESEALEMQTKLNQAPGKRPWLSRYLKALIVFIPIMALAMFVSVTTLHDLRLFFAVAVVFAAWFLITIIASIRERWLQRVQRS